MVLAVAGWATSRYRNLRENPNAVLPPPDPIAYGWRVLALFTLVSYVAWLKLFGIYRYLVPLEVISGALIVGCLLYVVRQGRMRVAIVVVLAVLLVGNHAARELGACPIRRSLLRRRGARPRRRTRS